MGEGGVQRGLRQGEKGEGAHRDEEIGAAPGLLSVSQAAREVLSAPRK